MEHSVNIIYVVNKYFSFIIIIVVISFAVRWDVFYNVVVSYTASALHSSYYYFLFCVYVNFYDIFFYEMMLCFGV